MIRFTNDVPYFLIKFVYKSDADAVVFSLGRAYTSFSNDSSNSTKQPVNDIFVVATSIF